MPEEKTREQNTEWDVQQRVGAMSRRYFFSDYKAVRAFLDRLDALSEDEGYYPDLSFSQTYVNVTIKARNEKLGESDYDFADKVDALIRE